MTWFHRVLLTSLAMLVFALLGAASVSAAEPKDDLARFEVAVKALTETRYGTAIRELEILADRGFVHPDVSFNRGLAYAKRAQTREEEPGDLGNAAASFEESLGLRPDDRVTEAALDTVRAEVTRRRSRQAKDDLIVRPSLDRLVVSTLSERGWLYVAAIGSWVFTLGFLLRRRPSGGLHVAGSIAMPLGLLVALAAIPVVWHGRWLAENRRPGVIVASEVNILGEDGRALDLAPIPEAARVEVGEVRGDNLLIRWGSTEGWVKKDAVRVLARGTQRG